MTCQRKFALPNHRHSFKNNWMFNYNNLFLLVKLQFIKDLKLSNSMCDSNYNQLTRIIMVEMKLDNELQNFTEAITGIKNSVI